MVKSPCTGVCKMDASGICIGCFRSVQQVTYWSTYDDATKRVVIEQARAEAERRGQPFPVPPAGE